MSCCLEHMLTIFSESYLLCTRWYYILYVFLSRSQFPPEFVLIPINREKSLIREQKRKIVFKLKEQRESKILKNVSVVQACWKNYIFTVCLYQTMVLYEIKSFGIFIVILTLGGIDSAFLHQRKIKCTLGRTLCEALSVKIVTLLKPHVHSKSP